MKTQYTETIAFLPAFHGCIVFALAVSQITLIGLMASKGAAASTPFLIALPLFTFFFHRFCLGRYEPAFVNYPLQQEAMMDTLERARKPNLNLRAYLGDAYVHPVFKNDEDDGSDFNGKMGDNVEMVPTKRQSRRNTPVPQQIQSWWFVAGCGAKITASNVLYEL